MKYHTTDPAERAASVADLEAERIWRETGSFIRWICTWYTTYNEALKEFTSQQYHTTFNDPTRLQTEGVTQP